MAIILTDFDKIWASSSPLTPYSFSDANYEEGWNFVGSTPPARQMWDGYMKWSDEKQQWIVNNFLPLAGGTMTGAIVFSSGSVRRETDDNGLSLYGGSAFGNGAVLQAFGKDHTSYPGWFSFRAEDGVNNKLFVGKPDGTLVWDGNTIPTKNVNIQMGKTESTSVSANGNADVSITFSPAFSSAPVVLLTPQTGYAGIFATAGSVTTSGATIKINNVSSTTRSIIVGWVAIDI